MSTAEAAHRNILADSRTNQRMSCPTHQPIPASAETSKLLSPARLTRPSEPILFPKVRIYFADFPYLHCSKTKGYTPWRPAADMGTVWPENISLTRIFKGRQECTWHCKIRSALREPLPYLVTITFQGIRSLQRKENSSRDSCHRLRARLRYRFISFWETFPRSGSGILTRFPFAQEGCTTWLMHFLYITTHS